MLTVGSKVMVVIPSKDKTGLSAVRKFKDKVTTITGEHHYRKGKTSQFRTYILDGCKSDFGIDYEFAEEWLVPIDEEV